LRLSSLQKCLELVHGKMQNSRNKIWMQQVK
jgi:hypothetical protein